MSMPASRRVMTLRVWPMAAWISSILWALLVAKMIGVIHCRISGSYGKNCFEADPEFAFQQLAFFCVGDELFEVRCGEVGAAVVVLRPEGGEIDRQPDGGWFET